MKVFESEMKLMNILWEVGAINSTELVKICNDRLGWKKSTTYTNLRRLSDRGIIINKNAQVRSLVTRDEVGVEEGKRLLGQLYDGSLSMLVAGFIKKEKVSKAELEELKDLIEKELDR